MQRSKTPNSIAPGNCPSCEAPFQGKFCNQCGEKQTSVQDFTIKKYAKSLFEHFSHLDSKLLRSVWFLISKPGFLSAEFVAGRQNLYMKPLQFFLVINLIFFFVLGDSDFFAPKVQFVYESNETNWIRLQPRW
jgi:hypothetical protein